MNKKLRVVQYGTGNMAKYSMRYVFEKGAEIVGAIDINPNVIGKDIGQIMECENKGVIISSVADAKEVLSNLKPDICIVTTMSLLNDVEEALKLCASLGINAITTCEEAFFPQNSNPQLTEEIDKLAKENNCTITGSGYQDIYWGELVSAIASSSHKITKIKGSSSYNVEDYGIALANAHGAGLTTEQFEEEIAALDNISEEERKKLITNREFMASYMWNVVGWLADKLELSITKMNQKCIPILAEEELESETLQMTVKKGLVRGMSAVVTATTKENIEIEAECIGKIYTSEEFDKNEWTIYGEPDTTLVINRPSTSELTCADIVNRIPDVINAESGFIETSKLESPSYRVKNLNEYVKKVQ